MATKKSRVGQELIAGLQEVLDHKRGGRQLVGRRRELPPPAPEWSARKIKRFREGTASMSQTEFAALLNVKVPTVRAWEQGINVPSGAAARLLQALDEDPTLVGKLSA
jgi:DNA-binding transcriptional regulator YiaG